MYEPKGDRQGSPDGYVRLFCCGFPIWVCAIIKKRISLFDFPMPLWLPAQPSRPHFEKVVDPGFCNCLGRGCHGRATVLPASEEPNIRPALSVHLVDDCPAQHWVSAIKFLRIEDRFDHPSTFSSTSWPTCASGRKCAQVSRDHGRVCTSTGQYFRQSRTDGRPAIARIDQHITLRRPSCRSINRNCRVYQPQGAAQDRSHSNLFAATLWSTLPTRPPPLRLRYTAVCHPADNAPSRF